MNRRRVPLFGHQVLRFVNLSYAVYAESADYERDGLPSTGAKRYCRLAEAAHGSGDNEAADYLDTAHHALPQDFARRAEAAQVVARAAARCGLHLCAVGRRVLSPRRPSQRLKSCSTTAMRTEAQRILRSPGKSSAYSVTSRLTSPPRPWPVEGSQCSTRIELSRDLRAVSPRSWPERGLEIVIRTHIRSRRRTLMPKCRAPGALLGRCSTFESSGLDWERTSRTWRLTSATCRC